jgi:LAO/AO transport system kinase
VLDVAGSDVVLVETVGVGQSEVEIASLADTTILVLAPGLGDGIQAAKAGIIEIADIFAVNKADLDGADQVVRDLRAMQSLGGRHSSAGSWRPPIVKTVAARGDGIGELAEEIEKYHGWMQQHGELKERRLARAAAEIQAIALGVLEKRLAQLYRSAAAGEAARVLAGLTDPYTAADDLLAKI